MPDVRPCRGDLFEPMCFPALVNCTFCVQWASGHANEGKCLGQGGHIWKAAAALDVIKEKYALVPSKVSSADGGVHD